MQFPTIHTWDRDERPFVLVSLANLRDKPFVHTFPRSGLGSCVLTSDPEVCEVAPAIQARAYEKDGLVAIPYDVAARLFSLEYDVSSFRGEIAGYQALIQGASLPVDEGSEGHAEEAKLSLETETLEPHEGVGSVSYFTLDPKYAVVEKDWLDEMLVGA